MKDGLSVDVADCIREAEMEEESLIGTKKSPAHRSLTPASARKGVCLWDTNDAEENTPNAARVVPEMYRPLLGRMRLSYKSREPTRSADIFDCGRS
jgi:hypothetical protein